MRLSQKQAIFTRNFAIFLHWALDWAERSGYYIVMEEFYRHKSATHGHPKSTHRKKLAGHLLLFSADTGQFMVNSSLYKPLGEFWKSLHPDNRHGGDWGDGNHFSMEHKGVK